MKTGVVFVTMILLMTVSALAGVTVHIPETVTFCGQTVPLDYADTRERLTTQLMVFQNKKVQVSLWYMRKNRFFPTIERVLSERGLPDDLKYICVIESSLIPKARSSANAYGPWQFLAPTARAHGLSVAKGIDERLHLDKATHAAMDYLEEMQQEFGSWTTAMAGYNAGDGRVKREIYRQGTSNYFEMELPDETERYVFNAIAVKLIFEAPERYGFDFSILESLESPATESVTLKLTNFIPIKMLAYAANQTFREFILANPWIRGVNLKKGTYRIDVPVGQKTQFLKRVNDYFKKINGFKGLGNGLKVTVKSEKGNMRIGPGAEYPVFRTVKRGDKFRVKGRIATRDKGHYWYIFKLDDGSSGWIWGKEIGQ